MRLEKRPMTEPRRPNPGSYAAVEAGCTCPVLDNNHGRNAPWPPNGWWERADCPMHGDGSTPAEPEPAIQQWEGMTRAALATGPGTNHVEPPTPPAPPAPRSALPGMVVVPRKWETTKKSGRRAAGNGWTLHTDTCHYVRRSTQTVPAPAEPYPGTVTCPSCKPTGVTRPRAKPRKPPAKPVRVAKSQPAKAKPMPPPPDPFHRCTYRQIDDGVQATCVCGISAQASTHDAARLRVYRKHGRPWSKDGQAEESA